MSSTRALLEVSDLTKVFDVSKPWLERTLAGEGKKTLKAVTDVSFSINKGETFALVGESGSGKSTIARMIVGLYPITSGKVLFDGIDVADPARAADMARERRRLTMIFQDPYASLNPRWRVDKIISEPIRAFGIASDPQDIEARVGELLRLVKLDPLDGQKYPHEFSGGQRQRIAIARALASRPEFIVCDEPTSALDVSVQAQVLNLMRDLQEQFGLTYLLISHNLAVIRHMATRVGVLYLGRLAEVAPSKDLFRTPRHPYTRLLLAAVPDLHGIGKDRVAVQGEIANPINPPSGCTFHPRCPLANERCKREVPLPRSAGAAVVACHAVEEGRS
ncbi:MAG TPA: ATP-binding cassette domain-containing protein [Beijerinckiaceae bacterium]|nr:ATP-binding cassette domain-containing protein [Beijerinckiaceae bacterium]